jgi:hypothetical protein
MTTNNAKQKQEQTMMNDDEQHQATPDNALCQTTPKRQRKMQRCTKMNDADKRRTMHEDKQGRVPNDAKQSRTMPNDA